MTTKEVSEKSGVCFSMCSRWAKENDVGRVQVMGILAYDWTEKDYERFLNRPKKRK